MFTMSKFRTICQMMCENQNKAESGFLIWRIQSHTRVISVNFLELTKEF